MSSLDWMKQWLVNVDVKAWLIEPWVARGVCALCAVWLLCVVIVDARQYGQLTHTPIPPLGPALAHDAIWQPTYALKTNVFGLYVPTQLEMSKVKFSSLQVTLVGLLYSSDPRASEVLIKPVGSRERVFHVGDEIMLGARIKRIMPDGILIESDGELERLTFKKNKD